MAQPWFIAVIMLSFMFWRFQLQSDAKMDKRNQKHLCHLLAVFFAPITPTLWLSDFVFFCPQVKFDRDRGVPRGQGRAQRMRRLRGEFNCAFAIFRYSRSYPVRQAPKPPRPYVTRPGMGSPPGYRECGPQVSGARCSVLKQPSSLHSMAWFTNLSTVWKVLRSRRNRRPC